MLSHQLSHAPLSDPSVISVFTVYKKTSPCFSFLTLLCCQSYLLYFITQIHTSLIKLPYLIVFHFLPLIPSLTVTHLKSGWNAQIWRTRYKISSSQYPSELSRFCLEWQWHNSLKRFNPRSWVGTGSTIYPPCMQISKYKFAPQPSTWKDRSSRALNAP